ncbi:MAG: quinol dehydrogenase ferredoxin subunit NapH [Thiotrichaceae bacterium]|nr:quinol dehydrogenase ferredoxin subunit NapH [Thiotrichaceae bacterium]
MLTLLRQHRWLILRRFSQLLVIGLFLVGPITGYWFIKGNMSSSLTLEILPLTEPFLFFQMLAAGVFSDFNEALIGVLIVVAFYFIVGGRVYCSWVCPINIITDAARWLRQKVGIRSNAHFSRQTRYWLLAAILLLAMVMGTLAYEFINPVTIIQRSLVYGLSASIFIVVIIFLFDFLISTRGWCGHLCPMGAMYSLIGYFSPITISATQRKDCQEGCNACFKVCPEPQVISLPLRGEKKGISPIIHSSNCTHCARCIDVCPTNVFEFKVSIRAKNKPITKEKIHEKVT